MSPVSKFYCGIHRGVTNVLSTVGITNSAVDTIVFVFASIFITVTILNVLYFAVMHSIEVYNTLRHKSLSKKYNCGDIKTYPFFPMAYPWYRIAYHILFGSFQHSFYEFIKGQNYRSGRMLIAGQMTFLTVEPENIKAILSTQFKEFGLGTRHASLSPLLGDGIFTLDGEGWHQSRQMLRPQFTRDQVSQLETLEVHSHDLIRNLLLQSTKTGGVEVQHQFFSYTMDTATEFLFGESTDNLGRWYRHEKPLWATSDGLDFSTAFNLSQAALFQKIAIGPGFGMFFVTPRIKRCIKLVHKFVDECVQKALARQRADEKVQLPGHQHYSYIFLDELVKLTQDPIVLRNQALNILLAGRDTTAGTLTWCMYFLAREPEVFAKLRQAVLEQYPEGTELSFEALKSCAYLRNFINEVLRLYPQVPANFREALVDTTIPTGGGDDGKQPIFVPKGTHVRYHIYTVHRMEKYWGEDATRFNPDRWEDKRSTGWEYLPFNGGPRICIGQQFALTELSFTLVRLLQSIKGVSFVDASDAQGVPWENVGLTLAHRDGFKLKLDPDEKSSTYVGVKEARLI